MRILEDVSLLLREFLNWRLLILSFCSTNLNSQPASSEWFSFLYRTKHESSKSKRPLPPTEKPQHQIKRPELFFRHPGIRVSSNNIFHFKNSALRTHHHAFCNIHVIHVICQLHSRSYQNLELFHFLSTLPICQVTFRYWKGSFLERKGPNQCFLQPSLV